LVAVTPTSGATPLPHAPSATEPKSGQRAPTPTVTPRRATPTPRPTVVSTRTPAPPPDSAARSIDADLQAAIAAAAAAYGEGISVFAWRLSDGVSAAIAPDTVYYAASTFKLAVLYAAEVRISDGQLLLDDRVPVTDADWAEDLGTGWSLHPDDAGTISVAEALEAMVTLSDNTSAVALSHLLGGEAIDALIAEAGLESTSVNTASLPTTAADLGRLMAAIVTHQHLSPDAELHARGLLMAQTWRFGIPAALPKDVPVGNKTGTWPGAVHDIAFIESPHGIVVLAILTDGSWGWEPMIAITAAAWMVLEGS
jgi:beta-lactamase class A